MLELRRVGFYYTNIRILEFISSYFVCFFPAFKFEELVPVAQDLEEENEKLFPLSEAKTSF